MANAEKQHHHIVFASRYSNSPFKAFRAFSALWRAEELVDDCQSLVELKAACDKAEIGFGQRGQTYEVVNYYTVGFVSCLEWHARSRLADLLVHDPSEISKGDVDRVGKIALQQMMSANVTVPYLVGAASSVGSVSEYISTFGQIFKALDVDCKLEAELRGREATYDFYGVETKTSLYKMVSELFERRHELVHEVTTAHFSLRELCTPSDAVVTGKAVVDCIKLVEKQITEKAPKDFPNRLDAEGRPEDETKKLEAEIAELEARIEKHTDKYEGADRWRAAVKVSKSLLEAESAFIEDAVFLRPVRHLDTRGAMRDELLRLRLAYLHSLVDEIETYGEEPEKK